MPWADRSRMSLVHEFVLLAGRDGANRAELCRRFGISRQTGYKWLRRHEADGLAGLEPRRPGPAVSPHRISASVEAEVLALRARHPAWGGRKLRARLLVLGMELVHDHRDPAAAWPAG